MESPALTAWIHTAGINKCRKHFTQEQVAERIGVSRQKYARIESGMNSITLEILSQIANILDVTVGDITRVLDEAPDDKF